MLVGEDFGRTRAGVRGSSARSAAASRRPRAQRTNDPHSRAFDYHCEILREIRLPNTTDPLLRPPNQIDI